MPIVTPPPGSSRESARPCGVWVGSAFGPELGFARESLGRSLELVECATIEEAAAWAGSVEPRSPTVVLLAADRPGRWRLDAVTVLARLWPLAPMVAVAASLGDGKRRSGPAVPGVEEVAWHELPGRVACWLDQVARCEAGALGVPATARRDDRLLESLAAAMAVPDPRPAAVSIAGGRGADLDGLAELLARVGRPVVAATPGLPPLDTATPLLVWDAVTIGADDVAWLRMLSANRPGLGIVLLESFPRGEVARAALRAGAGAVLARPLSVETLEGTLRHLGRRVC